MPWSKVEQREERRVDNCDQCKTTVKWLSEFAQEIFRWMRGLGEALALRADARRRRAPVGAFVSHLGVL